MFCVVAVSLVRVAAGRAEPTTLQMRRGSEHAPSSSSPSAGRLELPVGYGIDVYRLSGPEPFHATVTEDGDLRFDDQLITDAALRLSTALAPSQFGPMDPATGPTAPHSPGAMTPLFGIGFHFDVADAVYRLRHEDPYRYEKAKVLAVTSELRFQLKQRRAHERIVRALAELPGELVWIFFDPQRPLPARRQALATLWCEADSDEPGTRNLSAGQEARQLIEAFAARHDPAALSRERLAALCAQTP